MEMDKREAALLEALKVACEALDSVLNKIQNVETKMKDINLQLCILHNNDSLSADNLRAECLVLASEISYQFNAINPWNLKPHLNTARAAESKIAELLSGIEDKK